MTDLTSHQVDTSEYSALLQADEDACTLGCGCIIARNPNGCSIDEVAITFCPLHDAAEELLAAVERLSVALATARSNEPAGTITEWNLGVAAICRATGREDERRITLARVTDTPEAN